MLLLLFIFLIPHGIERVMCDKDITPVFLLDYSDILDDVKIDVNPFHKVSTAIFADIVHTAIKRGEVVIVFVEDQFATEDISTRDALGTPYRNLREGLMDGKVRYLPKVIEPYRLLKQVFQPHQFNVFHVGSDMDLQMLDQKFKHLYIFFRKESLAETRVEMLRRHDLIMREVYTVMSKLVQGPVLAFYTGKMNPVQVDKVEFVPIAPVPEAVDAGVMVVTDGALFRFSGVYAATQTRRAVFNQAPIVAEETWTDKTLSTKMAYTDFDLEFNFLLGSTDWLLESVTLYEGGEEVGRTNTAVTAPWYHSYYCGEPLVVINKRDGSSVTISEYQIQAMRQRRDKCRQNRRRTAKSGKDSPKNIKKNAIETPKKISSRPDKSQDGSKHGRRDLSNLNLEDYTEKEYKEYVVVHELYFDEKVIISGTKIPSVKFHLTPYAKKLIKDYWDDAKKINSHLLDYYNNKKEIRLSLSYFEYMLDSLERLKMKVTPEDHRREPTMDPDMVELHYNETLKKLVSENLDIIKRYGSDYVQEVLLYYVKEPDVYDDIPSKYVPKKYLEEVPAFLKKLMTKHTLDETHLQLVLDNYERISSDPKFKDLRWLTRPELPRSLNSFRYDETINLLSQLTTSSSTTEESVLLYANDSISELVRNNWDDINIHAGSEELRNVLKGYRHPDNYFPKEVPKRVIKKMDSFLEKVRPKYSIEPNYAAQLVRDNIGRISKDRDLSKLLLFLLEPDTPKKVNLFKKKEIEHYLSGFTTRLTTTPDPNLVVLYPNNSLWEIANSNWDVISKHADDDLKNILYLYASPDRNLPKQVSKSHLKKIDSFLKKLNPTFSIQPNASIARLILDNYDTIHSDPSLKDLLWFIKEGALPKKVNAFKKEEIDQLLTLFTTRLSTSSTTTADPNLVVLYPNNSLSEIANNNWDVISKHADADLKNILVLYASPDRNLPKQVSKSYLKNIDSFLEKLQPIFSIQPNASIAQLVTDNYETISSDPALKDLLWFIKKGALPKKVNAFKKEEIDRQIAQFTARPAARSTNPDSGNDGSDMIRGCTAVEAGPGLGCTPVEYDEDGNYIHPTPGASSDAPEGGDGSGEGEGGDGAADECGGFGKTVNCNPYFSAGILAALFIVWLWLIALAIGFSALYDIKTNDKFDDPQGKMPDTTER